MSTEIKLTPETYNALVEGLAKIASIVREFPSDAVLLGVRTINAACEKEETGERRVKQQRLCEESIDRRAFIEEVAVGLVAAKIKIENAMQTYATVAKDLSPEQREKAGLFVPANAGKVTLD